MNHKKHYLLVWPTVRKDWIQVFEDLKDEYQLTFLPSAFPKEPNHASHYDCCYWSEFASTQEILDKVQPDGIIFMSIESGMSMALNHVAKKRGIKTIILQHGIFTNYKDYRNREKLWRKKSLAQEIKQEQFSKRFSTFQFIRNSLEGVDKLEMIKIVLYTNLQQRIGPYWTAKHLPLKIKRASQYLCFSPYNATIHRETDRIKEEQITYIGSPELIPYLRKESDLIQEDFYLHIDQALAENSFGEETVPKEKMTEFYLKLNDFCLGQNARLFIKLHPESYQSHWLPQHENIKYFKQIDNFNRYIQSAKGCFGFYSTMIIPAIYWKPTTLFYIQYSGLQEAITSIQSNCVVDFWDFRLSDIKFNIDTSKKKVMEKFISDDKSGMSIMRLKNALNS